MLPALCLYLLLHVLGTLKWQIMINAAGAGLSWVHSARCYYAGLFANTFLISLVGGDVVRAGMAMRQARSKAGLLVGSLADRLFDVAGLLAITLGGALWMPSLVDHQSRQLFRGLLLAAGLLGVAGVGLRVLLPARRLPFKVRRLPGPVPGRDACRGPPAASGAPGRRTRDRAPGEPRAPERLAGRRLRVASAALGLVLRLAPGEDRLDGAREPGRPGCPRGGPGELARSVREPTPPRSSPPASPSRPSSSSAA